MSLRQKKRSLFLETAKELVERELQSNGNKFITTTDKPTHDKVNRRHSRVLNSLVHGKSMNILLGILLMLL